VERGIKFTNIIDFVGCLTPFATIFRLYHGGQFYWMEETGLPGENHRPAASHCITKYCIEYTLQ